MHPKASFGGKGIMIRRHIYDDGHVCIYIHTYTSTFRSYIPRYLDINKTESTAVFASFESRTGFALVISELLVLHRPAGFPCNHYVFVVEYYTLAWLCSREGSQGNQP